MASVIGSRGAIEVMAVAAVFVIQCAATKRGSAGCLRAEDGRRVVFVANPSIAPESSDRLYKRPDDRMDANRSYRDAVVTYDRQWRKNPQDNPYGLLAAWRLYKPPVYEDLVRRFGIPRVFILSAGWGLIPADFLTPCYDITFGYAAEKYKRRRGDGFRDLMMLPADSGSIVFLGGKEYRQLFCRLTEGTSAERIVFYRASAEDDQDIDLARCKSRPFRTRTRTNWHYECAQALIEEKIAV